MIRGATAEDLARIAEIHSQSWHFSYSDILSPDVLEKVTPESRLTAWEEWFDNNSSSISVHEEAGDVLGFTLICAARDVSNPPENYGELTHLYLDTRCIGKGIGNNLFLHARNSLQSRGFRGFLLWTLQENTPARRFYESHNMIHDGTYNEEPGWLGPGIKEVRYIFDFQNEEE